jgi:hypothetical protein
MLCVTIIERIVRKTSRPIRTVPEKRAVPDRQRRPRIAVTAPADGDRAARVNTRADERPPTAKVETGPEVRHGADRGDLVALDRPSRPDPHPVAEDDAWRHDQRSRIENDALADHCAVLAIGRDLLVRRECAESVGIGPERREQGLVDCTDRRFEREGRREGDVLDRDACENGIDRLLCGCLRSDERLDVLRRDEALLVDRVEVDAVTLGQLDRLLRRLALRRRGGLPLSARRIVAPGPRLLELVGALGDQRDRPTELDLGAALIEVHERSGARRFELERRLRRLHDADRVALAHLRPVGGEPLRQERDLGVRVLAREDDLEHALGTLTLWGRLSVGEPLVPPRAPSFSPRHRTPQ